MAMFDEKDLAGGAGLEAVEALVASGGLDGLFEQIESSEVSLSSDGLLSALLKKGLERGLRAGLTDHLGYDKGGRPTPAARGSASNGASTKTIDSEVGSFEIEVPRDRAGTFTPRLVKKGQRRMDGLDAMIIGLYPHKITVCQIRRHLESALAVELSAGTISHITDRGRRRRHGVAAPPAGGVPPGDLPRRDPCRGPSRLTGDEQGGPHRRRR